MILFMALMPGTCARCVLPKKKGVVKESVTNKVNIICSINRRQSAGAFKCESKDQGIERANRSSGKRSTRSVESRGWPRGLFMCRGTLFVYPCVDWGTRVVGLPVLMYHRI